MKAHVTKFITKLVGISAGFMIIASPAFATEQDTVKLSIIGTSDVHGNLTSWSYENEKDYENAGFVRISTFVNDIREENENTIVIDNGDTIQGTLLTDELFNGFMDKDHPVIDIMNYINYDLMVLGNHEFNFGVKYLEKLEEDAEFPFLAANIYDKATGEHFVEPYIIKEYDGVKVGIIGLTIPDIPNWDGTKDGVLDLEYNHLAYEARKYVDILKDKVDVIIVSAHAGLDDDTDGSSARLIAETCPEIDLLIIGHHHVEVNEVINGVRVIAPSGYRQVSLVNLEVAKNEDDCTVTEELSVVYDLKNFEVDPNAEKLVEYADKETLEFLSDTIGTVTENFQPENEISMIAQGYLQDTPIVDLINIVQLEATGADVSSAALFKSSSDLLEGDLNYSDIFNIYKYPNKLVAVDVSGAELKAYMEWSAGYYNTYKDGDLIISFTEGIPAYDYDMFQGIEYKVDISQPVGSRIKDVMFKGEPLKDDTILSLAINDYRYNGIGPNGLNLISGTPTFQSDKALRMFIKEYIEQQGAISPQVDNNWEVIGCDWDEDLRKLAVKALNDGTLTIHKNENGYFDNAVAITETDLKEAGITKITNQELMEKLNEVKTLLAEILSEL
ncbi:hypothetical protein AN639_05135 [Candidatus Epulonipiscium fishelsonii]|uniref:Uncharacterized protein n=1 Tax=Candidatus Epulonipiscium fishelsonii TaxID=77094 RepID=A0ACC8XBP3_9FIRM|nr:hypothetical protein AN396_06820 [Epulopiscium sp. SCG-B11WGA-EpuloA1]ONI40269.1 hypothetical protein AN639_05135 [Epulopiscium sp. SCG-B05WGA-EpuloA1]